MDKHQTEHDLEAIVDREGLGNVLTFLASICHEKAEHVITNWQDKALGRAWEIAGKHLNRVALSVDFKNL